MLQNPSKYHPNPLSHFLALHNSNNNNNNNNHHNHHHYQQSSINNNQLNGTLNGNSMVNTSLDVGKSFTIAAILGLQKNAIEQHQQNHRDFNSVMNLSLNGHNNVNNQKNINNNNNNFDIINCVNSSNNNSCNTNNSNNNNNNNSNNSSGHNNNFDCDSVNNVVNRYLPNTNGNNNNNGHLRLNANHFGAVNVAAKVNGPSALQSLQQLHQQHAQQQAAAAAASLGYQRDKIKEHLSSKKSSLKSKRVRTIFTPEQLERLEAEFERQQYMVGPERLYLAHTLQLTEAQVKVWFQNRRIKWRKHHLEITQQRLALIRQTQITNGDEEVGGVGGGGVVGDTVTNCITNDSGTDLVANIIQQDNLSSNNNSPILMTPIIQYLNNQSDSDLSICNDSIDGESIVDGDNS